MSIDIYKLESGITTQESGFSKPGISLDEITRQLPQGLYSTFRTFGGAQKVLGLQSHFDRLFGPAEIAGIITSASEYELRQSLRKLLGPYQSSEARVRISVSLSEKPGLVFIAIEPLKLLDATIYQNGVKLVTSHIERSNPRLKTTGFISKSEIERKTILQNGIFEAVMVHNNQILEGLTSNFYTVKGQKIISARKGILLGVTRRAVLRLARVNGFSIDYRALGVEEIPWVDEAFITSSSRGVVPVVEIDGIAVGQGMVGGVVKSLIIAYDSYVIKNAETI